jgi:hypothetical protein
MKIVYLDAANGLKEAQLTDVQVENAEELQKLCTHFLCEKIVFADPEKVFLAQNITTHIAQLSGLIKKVSPQLHTVYISDHEIRWIKEMLEIPGYQPDSTHSNYRLNTSVESEIFDIKLFDFNRLTETIMSVEEPAVFYVSHISRLTGETTDIAPAYKLIKDQNRDSIFIVDGAQSVGAATPVEVNKVCDVYLGTSMKFLGAEPSIGIAFLNSGFFERYVGQRETYPQFNASMFSKDLFSLWKNLQHPRFTTDYYVYIKYLKEYAVTKIREISPDLLFAPDSQAPNFLTLNFGGVQNNKKFVTYAFNYGIRLSDNINLLWSLIEPPTPLIRIGISVQTEKEHIDRLVDIIKLHKKEETSRG